MLERGVLLMKKILINILEASIGILFILLIIYGIKYRASILDYIKNQTAAVSSDKLIEETAAQDHKQDTTEFDEVIQEQDSSVDQEVLAEVPEPVQEEPEKIKATKLVFTGDILFTGYLLTQYDNSGINGIVSQEIVDEMINADLMMVNEEFPFSNKGTAMENKQFTFRIEPERIQVFHDLGIDIVTLANNHTLDYGQEALADTFETLDQAGIQYVGAGNNYEEAKTLREFDINDKKIGILAASRVIPEVSWAAGTSPGVFSTYDASGLVEEIKEADASCDKVIVYVHWGVEKSEYPEDYQRELAKQYIDAGADLVIGAHPHVLQGIEYYNGIPIVYSLGNFIFGSQIPKTVFLKAEIDEEGNLSLAVEACATDAAYVLNKASNQQEIYQYLTEISPNAVINENGIVSEKVSE
jgi:hypothetical protein